MKIERNILIMMNNFPFIIKLYYAFQTHEKLYFILEYCPGGELFKLLERKVKLPEAQARFYAAQIVLALEYLHSNSIVFMDLKPENVLIDAEGNLKLTDFGLSWMESNFPDHRPFCGTPEYLAPEIIQKQQHGKPVDWWTLGNIIYEMIIGFPPFYADDRTDLIERILYT